VRESTTEERRTGGGASARSMVQSAARAVMFLFVAVAGAVAASPRAQADDAYPKEFLWMCVDEYDSNGCELWDCQWYDFVTNLKSVLQTRGGLERPGVRRDCVEV